MKQASRPESPAHCTFCDLIKGAAEVSVCHEDSDAIAFMDIQPVNNGHVLVVPREHYESLLDVPEEIGMHLFRVTMRLANAVRKVTGTDDLNIVVNSGVHAGQDEPHYHVHIIPRRAGDGFDIPLPFNGSQMPDRTVLDAYAAQIIAALRDPMRADADSIAVGPGPVLPDSVDRNERSVPVPVFAESSGEVTGAGATVEGEAKSDDAGLSGVESEAHEGAHGELVLDQPPERGDAS
jgi:histidine triad (HIT) family protein